MTAELVAIAHDARDPERLAGFWSSLLGRTLVEASVIAEQGSGFRIEFFPTTQPKTARNRIHFDLTSTSPDHQRALVARAIELGGGPVDIGQRADEPHVVLADPEGNEFCVIQPGNRFLADTDAIGAVNCDGTQALGYFWSAALGWPLVWDQDQETAVQSPRGGSKLTWSGPPLMPPGGRRLRLVLAAEDLPTEVRRLISLGATVLDSTGTAAVLSDPDGNEFVARTTTRLVAPPRGKSRN